MKKQLLAACLFLTVTMVTAQTTRKIEVESKVESTAEVMIKGKRVPYKATAGTQPVWDEKGEPIASLFYTYYERTDVVDRAKRPLVVSFNGGPGSASIWMHLAYTGPVVLNIDDEGYPVQPYGTKSNPHSILDVADIVYIDPVNTGYSRIVKEDTPRSTFFGINSDIKYLADWVNTFVTRQNRWASPKYLIGESYGTTRVAGLVSQLQNSHWMYFNGVILVSPTDMGILRDGPVKMANYWPYYAATAWYHKALPAELQAKDLDEILAIVEPMAVNEILPAMAKGGLLTESEREAIAEKYIREVGLAGFEQKFPHQLSGGMRQRVGLARALSVNAEVLLLDEPFSAVDEQTRRKFQEDLLELVKNEKKTFIFVTHSIEEAVYVSDQIAILLPRPSRVSEIIRPSSFRDKSVDNIRRDPEYLDIVDRIWASLRSYVE
jgi:ABC-type sugar transport system ATPase subunit